MPFQAREFDKEAVKARFIEIAEANDGYMCRAKDWPRLAPDLPKMATIGRRWGTLTYISIELGIPLERTRNDKPVTKDVLDKLLAMGADGVMPSCTEWDGSKGADEPGSSTIRAKMGMNWGELAAHLGLVRKINTDTRKREDEPWKTRPIPAPEVHIYRMNPNPEFINNAFICTDN